MKIPKLRKLTFETAIIERYKRREAWIEESLIEMYLAGVSMRRIEDITEALWGTRVSSGTVSNLNKKAYENIEAWRNKIRGMILETLTYYNFPAHHWRKIRTNNTLERIMREIRRRTRVVGAFPDGHSALMLSAARLRHIAGTKWGLQRYMDMDEMNGHQTMDLMVA